MEIKLKKFSPKHGLKIKCKGCKRTVKADHVIYNPNNSKAKQYYVICTKCMQMHYLKLVKLKKK